MQKHFVTFLSPGTFCHEETINDINSWDVAEAVAMARKISVRHGATPFGFYFTTKARRENELDSKVVKTSNMYYLGGKVETIDEVRARKDLSEYRRLLSNMEGIGWNRIIVNTNSWKITQPLRDDDVVLDFSV